MEKLKVLLILHHSPPVHGAAKIGDAILNSKLLNEKFETRFIKIESSKKLSDVRKFKIIKLYYFIKLLITISLSLVVFRPQRIYFTVSPNGKAFYRDLILSLPIKLISLFINVKVFYHYHSGGMKQFVSSSLISKKLTSFFIKKVHLIFISVFMKEELSSLDGYDKLHILNNGVDEIDVLKDFEEILEKRAQSVKTRVLFLSNMMLDKGYDVALELAKKVKELQFKNIEFHFAGEWFTDKDKCFFNEYVLENNLEKYITYHGFVDGTTKKELFEKVNMLIFPSKKEVFPLSLLEALSYGLPILTFDVGAVSEIVTEDVGIISSKEKIVNSFIYFKNGYLNKEVSLACRKRYLENYTTGVFEQNLVNILLLKNEYSHK